MSTQMQSENKIEADFFSAYKRLCTHSPHNLALKARAIAGKLEINLSTLALEAGHSRTLISMSSSKYPRVRALIFPDEHVAPGHTQKVATGGAAKRPTHVEVLRAIREEKALLKLERDRFATRLAETEIAIALLQRENSNLKLKLHRLGGTDRASRP